MDKGYLKVPWFKAFEIFTNVVIIPNKNIAPVIKKLKPGIIKKIKSDKKK